MKLRLLDAYVAVCTSTLIIISSASCQGQTDNADSTEEPQLQETAGASVGLFEHIRHVRAMRDGFEEISSDWDGFADRWAFAERAAFDSLENEALIMHSTEEELRNVYRFRGAFYQRLARDSVRNVACGPQRTLEDVMNLLGDLRTEENMRQVGRSLARQHEGYDPWSPPAPLRIDEGRRGALIQYLMEVELTDVARTFTAASGSRDVTDEALCVAQGTLYTLAADQPDDQVGNLRLIDYVRLLEASALPRR